MPVPLEPILIPNPKQSQIKSSYWDWGHLNPQEPTTYNYLWMLGSCPASQETLSFYQCRIILELLIFFLGGGPIAYLGLVPIDPGSSSDLQMSFVYHQRNKSCQVFYFVWFTGNEYLDSLKGRSHQAAISFWLVSTSRDGELCRLDMGQADGGVMVDWGKDV